MSRRFFISDLHFNGTVLVEKHLRPFKSVERMNDILIKNINQRCKEDDILIHVGDLCQYGNDRIWDGENTRPSYFTDQINPMIINIQGNHDLNNKVKSVCNSMRITMGKFKAVSLSHYPSSDPRAKGSFLPGDVHIHGHNHNGPIFSIDKKNQVLNVNVCCDLWKYNPVSEQELITKIEQFMRFKSMEHKNRYNKNVTKTNH